MKKIIIGVVAVVLAALVLIGALSFGGQKLSGTYENVTLGLHIVYTFSGNKFTRSMYGLTENDTGISTSGTYRVAKGYIYLVSESGTEEVLTYSKSGKTIYIAEMDFVKQ